ncbi:hypothetical protein DD238_001856 [Peronospora effusa]|uniref:GOLD domain-containing protein n=1 Tax=Peronospora effusa TaxID=542832 RepID=A0A3M6VTY3_9STRA|nr:hypothetical protein DD238_001856 [Peronospora effusa]
MMMLLVMLLVSKVLAQGDFAMLDPDVAAVAEDPAFNPYHENIQMVETDAKVRDIEKFDFDPSEGLTFYVTGKSRACFYQETKDKEDELSGAYIVSSADSHVDLEVKNPEKVTIYRQLGDAEGQYLVKPTTCECVGQVCVTLRLEEEMNKRVMFYGALECTIYLLVCFYQVYYIKGLLDNPHKARSWV